MARPRKDDDRPSARARIKGAFWTLMEKGGFSTMTVGALCRTANVSPNTLYYHFANLEEVAQEAFSENLPWELPRLILENLQGRFYDELVDEDSNLPMRARRIMLFAASDSTLLRSMVADAFILAWLNTLSVSEGEPSDEEWLGLRFIAAGMVSMLGSASYEELAPRIPGLLESPLGQGVVKQLKGLQKA